jgi:GTP-binding protein
MAQTKFVLSKAIDRGLKPIVLINKVDRESSRVHEVESEILDLFIALGAPDDLLDYPVLYASAKEGWAVADADDKDRSKGMAPLLQAIVDTIDAPCGAAAVGEPFTLAVNSIQTDAYVGRLCMGKIHTGSVKVGDAIKALTRGDDMAGGSAGASVAAEGRVTKLLCQRGMEKMEIPEAAAGDIVWVAGVTAGVADTIAAPEVSAPLPTQPLDPPTLAMTFGPNDSPLGGREGKFVTGTHVLERLNKELENNVSIALAPSPEPESVEVLGRGELQMGILITEMRREGYELSVSPPRVLTRKDPATGKTLEPIEEVTIDVDQELSGPVVEKLNARKGTMVHFGEHRGKARLVFHVPSRGLLGFMNEVKTDTRGSAVVTRMVKGYEPSVGQIDALFKGKLISMESGTATAYALNMLEDRGVLFIEPGAQVYPGMILGEHNRPVDLDVNPCRAKKMTNVRSVNADEAIRLAPPRVFGLEEYIAYMNEDEKLEITPTKLRLRKRELDPGVRARKAKSNKK